MNNPQIHPLIKMATSMNCLRTALRQTVASSSRQVGRATARELFATAAPRRSQDFAVRAFSQSSRSLKEKKEPSPEEASKLSEKTSNAVFGADKGGAGAADGASSAEVEKLQTTIKEKEARIKELTDAVLYGKADLQNAQRRAAEDKASASDYAITRLARDLTSSLDVLRLALNSVPEDLRSKPAGTPPAEDPKKVLSELYSGVDLTRKSLLDVLKTHGITEFNPVGEKFDPQSMEALYQGELGLHFY